MCKVNLFIHLIKKLSKVQIAKKKKNNNNKKGY